MSDMQDPIERAYYAMLDAAVAMGKAERAYEQALAEETWEYSVQFKNEESGKWYTNDFYSAGIHGQKWFTSKEEAEQQIKRSYPADLVEPREYRIVRRRVSPPEVINE